MTVRPLSLQRIIDATKTRDGPLNGLIAVDLSRHIPGPMVSTLLANLGATIIRFEPQHGDPLRHSISKQWDVDPYHSLMDSNTATSVTDIPSNNDPRPTVYPSSHPPSELSTTFQSQLKQQTSQIAPENSFCLVNNNKFHSLMYNLKDPQSRKEFYTILSYTHVLVESYRPGIINKILQLTMDEIKKEFPNLIVCSLTGFGQHSAVAGHDINFQARSGLLGTNVLPSHLPLLSTIHAQMNTSSPQSSLLFKSFSDMIPSQTLSVTSSLNSSKSKLQICPPQLYLHHHPPSQFTLPPLSIQDTLSTSEKAPPHPSLRTMLQIHRRKIHELLQPIRLPVVPNVITGDGSGVLFAFGYILSQLYAQKAQNKHRALPNTPSFHQFIDVSISDAAFSFSSSLNLGILSSNITDSFLSYELSGHYAHYTTYQTADSYLVTGACEEHFWYNICKLTELDKKYGIMTLPCAISYPFEFYTNVLSKSIKCQSMALQQYQDQHQDATLTSYDIYCHLLLSELTLLEQHWVGVMLYNEYVKVCLQYEFIQKTTQEWMELLSTTPSHSSNISVSSTDPTQVKFLRSEVCIEPINTMYEAYEAYYNDQYAAQQYKEQTSSLYTSAGHILPVSPLLYDATFANGLSMVLKNQNGHLRDKAPNYKVGMHQHYVLPIGKSTSDNSTHPAKL